MIIIDKPEVFIKQVFYIICPECKELIVVESAEPVGEYTCLECWQDVLIKKKS